jgi:hypothetical protein
MRNQEFKMETLFLIHQKLPVGMQPTLEDWNKAYEMVYTKAVIDTIEWKLNHITISRGSF